MKKVSFIVAAILVVLQGCTDHFNELNVNPASFAEVEPGTQLTKIQLDMTGNRELVWYEDLGITSPLAQQLSGSWWVQHGGQYRTTERSHFYSLWEQTYPREIKNITDIIRVTANDPNQVNMNSVARMMRVYIFAKLTDLYGDIPYSEAAQGYTQGIFLPKYDKQEAIYADFFKELDEAVRGMDNARPRATGDIWYSGDVNKWRKFGNSLRLRLGMRLTKVNAAEAQKQVAAAIAAPGGLMESVADNAVTRHAATPFTAGSGDITGNGRSQVFQSTNNSESYRLTRPLVNLMKNQNDPRLFIFGGTYLKVEAGGIYPGDAESNPAANDITPYLQMGIEPGYFAWSAWADQPNVRVADGQTITVGSQEKFMQPSKYVAALNAPFFHLTYAEVKFLLAEAAVRGWNVPGSAEENFMQGLEAAVASAEQYPGAPATSTTALNTFKESYASIFGGGNTQDKLEAIGEQLWLNFFLNGAEAYSSWRRTGYPQLVPFTRTPEGEVSTTNGVIPRRLFYPSSEAIQNSANYNEAISRMGGDNWLNRVWWDAQ
ncbi:SusD/RagB family nutrient-binding outer membrane lipoprotein [Pontibacter sp. SGAir0037]|uniref:SusD/RagB family nutrient-binding outer membrane lipoprotein n=1 Tax=Pontibacter sp. SGAir0037 TaxID=2571030 RepID=UPI0010CD47D5|nr:SusD/RagB family nutrient-binding outer membrane lipoprotein [Pontibacter sp. SGAir0037]QCR23501.1 hypothetical protein C1N53_14890 [Pontibacter sp. SGAir0037]